MDLPIDGVEYVKFTLTDLPTGLTPEACIGDSGDWHPLTHSGSDWKLLVRGPEADSVEGVLVPESSLVRVRIIDNPQVVIRRSPGQITLVG